MTVIRVVGEHCSNKRVSACVQYMPVERGASPNQTQRAIAQATQDNGTRVGSAH